MRVMVLGIRGLPDVQGGVETHAKELYGRLAASDCAVEVIVRTPFVPVDKRTFGAIRLRRIWSPRTPGLEALVHSVLGVLYAGIARPDVLHIHAVGPAVVTLIARMLGLRVVVTHHGPDYDREKWGSFARWVLKTGESIGMRYAHARIGISKVIVDLIRSKYGLDASLIPNGVVVVGSDFGVDQVTSFGLQPGHYFLQVSRVVPEKRQLDLILAYTSAALTGWKLALVGGLGDDEYSAEVMAAAKNAGVVLTGFLKGVALQQLYAHAGAFVLPSSHEGLPIALLEALSYGLPVLASDIPANLEVELEPSSYFPVGDISALSQKLAQIAREPRDHNIVAARKRWVAQKYDWARIAAQTLAVLQSVSKSKGGRTSPASGDQG